MRLPSLVRRVLRRGPTEEQIDEAVINLGEHLSDPDALQAVASTVDPPAPEGAVEIEPLLQRLVHRLNPRYISTNEAASPTSSVPYIDIDAPDDPPSHYVVKAGGKSFAVGIDWSDGSTLVGRGTTQAKDDHRAAVDVPLFFISHTLSDRQSEQYGTISSRTGVDSSCYSLAQLLVDRAGPVSFIALFEFDDGSWYFVAAREGVLRPQTDVCVPAGQRFDLVAQARRLLGKGEIEWDYVFAPKVLDIANSEEFRLQDILEGPLQRPLRHLYPPLLLYMRYAMVLVGIPLVVGLGWYAYTYAEKWFQSSTEAQQIVSRLSTLVLEPVPVIPEAPWERGPIALAPQVTSYCLDEISQVPVFGWSPTAEHLRGGDVRSIPIGGYSLSAVLCTDGQLELDLSPVLQDLPQGVGERTRINWPIKRSIDSFPGPLEEFKPLFFEGDPVIGEEGRDPFKIFLSQEIRRYALLPFFDFYSVGVNLGPYERVHPEHNPSLSSWGFLTFSLASDRPLHNSDQFNAFLESHPSLLFESLEYSPTSSMWKYTYRIGGYTSSLADARNAQQRNDHSTAEAKAHDEAYDLVPDSY